MSTNTNVRLRIITLISIFQLNTDEEHILSMAELCEMLEEYGITADRRAVLADIKTLCEGGYEVVSVNKPKKGYYMVPRIKPEALSLMMKGIYTSEVISDDDCKIIVNNPKCYMCQPTADFFINTTMSVNRREFSSCHIKRECSTPAREAIIQKKVALLTLKSFSLGNEYSSPTQEIEMKVNPHKIVVTTRNATLAFTTLNNNDVLYCVDFARIKSIEVLRKEAVLMENPDYFHAINYFTKNPIIAGLPAFWLFLTCKNESLEAVSEFFGDRLYVKKSETDGYFLAKIYTHRTYSLLGWLTEMHKYVHVTEPTDIRLRIESMVKY